MITSVSGSCCCCWLHDIVGSYYSMEAKDDERMRATLESSDLLLSSKMVTKHRSHFVHPRDPRLETDTFIGGIYR